MLAKPAAVTPNPSPSGVQTILGANGVIARELSAALGRKGLPVRQVSRRPRPVNAGDELCVADLLDARAVANAVAGSAVVYLVAGLPYDAAVWQVQWPVVMRNVIAACEEHGARLVFFDNVYAYGWVQGLMSEDTPFAPCSRKGEVRAAIASQLLDAMAQGRVEAMIARSADFYGPGATNSFLTISVFNRLRAGKSPQWLGDPMKIHHFTYTPDAGHALAELGQIQAAYGQTWHLPTADEAVTGQALAGMACEVVGRSRQLQVLPDWLLAPLGWFVPPLRESREMMYQMRHDYRFDSRKIERLLGLRPTPYRAGVEATWCAPSPQADG